MRRAMNVLLVVLAMILVACGGGDTGDTTEDAGTATTGADAAATTAAAADTTMAEAETAAATLTVASTDLGDVVVDGDGYTLYLFTPDGQDAGVSTCEDECLANWPPLGEAQAGDGVDGSLIGTIERSDGSTQATYNGWPLYYFINDAAAGDTTGQGVNDVWFAVTPDGSAVGMDDGDAAAGYDEDIYGGGAG